MNLSLVYSSFKEYSKPRTTAMAWRATTVRELLCKVIDKTNYKYFSDHRSKDAFKRESYHVWVCRK